MADQEETFVLQNSPGSSDTREIQSDNKPEKQNGTSSKSPSSQTTYIQQVGKRLRASVGPARAAGLLLDIEGEHLDI